MKSGFERMTSSVAKVISLEFLQIVLVFLIYIVNL